MKNDVTHICGPYPDGFIKSTINSDPNFVFTNDPNFGPVKLWDIDGNSAFVNSFIECEHYVTGGWNYNPAQNSEYLFKIRLELIAFVLITYLFVTRKFNK